MFTAGQYEASVAASERAAELARTGGDDLTRVRTDVQRLNILQVLSRQGNQSWWSGRSWPSFNAWVHAWTRAEPSRL